jgi:hypothetical protein
MKHGNTTAIAVSRPFLFALNWLPGQAVILELLEDGSGFVVRLPKQEDFGPVLPPRLARPSSQNGYTGLPFQQTPEAK